VWKKSRPRDTLAVRRRNALICVVCKKGETREGFATVPLVWGGTPAVRTVPAEICDDCGEAYVSEEVTKNLLAPPNERSTGRFT
jgi:YgiT-type zinc finger domain-containing protein